MKKLSPWWILCVLWCAVIFFLSNKPSVESQMQSMYIVTLINGWLGRAFGPGTIEITDGMVRKMAHFLEYMILGILLFKSFFRGVTLRTALWLPLLVGVSYSISDEIHQLFVPGRSARFIDVMIDSLGLALGVLLAMAPWRRQGIIAPACRRN